MQNHHRTSSLLAAFVALSLISAGCVSVKLNSGSSKKAESVRYADPSSPFHTLSGQDKMDRAWQSAKTGATMGYLSECGGLNLPLESLENDVTSGLEETKIVSSEKRMYNNRESITTVAEGQVHGVPVKLKLLVFHKGDCSFTLTYVSRAPQFDSEVGVFDTFLNRFEVP